MKEELEKITFKYLCGLFNEDELHEWMRKEINQNPNPHPDIFDLNAKEPYKARAILLKVAKDIYSFDPFSLDSMDTAKKVFIEVSVAYLKQEVAPLQFCSMINLLDRIYIGSSKLVVDFQV